MITAGFAVVGFTVAILTLVVTAMLTGATFGTVMLVAALLLVAMAVADGPIVRGLRGLRGQR